MTTQTAKRALTLGAAALILTLAAGAALAGPGRGGREGGVLRRALASLDLSEEQKAKVQAIVEESKPGFEALRSEGRAGREALKAAAEKPAPDAKEVGEAFLLVQANRKVARTQMEAVKAKVDAVLTPEQKAKLDGYLAGLRERGRRPGQRGEAGAARGR